MVKIFLNDSDSKLVLSRGDMVLTKIYLKVAHAGMSQSTNKQTYSIRIHFVFRATASSHHRLEYSYPALLVREAGSHKV